MKKIGDGVNVLDFKSPEKSRRYDLLQPIIDAAGRDDFEKAENVAMGHDERPCRQIAGREVNVSGVFPLKLNIIVLADDSTLISLFHNHNTSFHFYHVK
ncbi:MAG: hypothetical protein LBJ64_03425 [Deltaproteobacteria bacterium]|nr:hypothetical protein [Deltaproteobacteria bacterium]